MLKLKYLVNDTLYEGESEFLEVVQDGLKVVLKPKTTIKLIYARLYLPLEEGKYYCNGFQSWTDSA